MTRTRKARARRRRKGGRTSEEEEEGGGRRNRHDKRTGHPTHSQKLIERGLRVLEGLTTEEKGYHCPGWATRSPRFGFNPRVC
jgi:hypothetical protein